MPSDQPVPEVVKVQRPLAGAASPSECLVYASGRDRLRVQRVTPRVMAALGADDKGYFDAWWSEPAGWIIGLRVADQDW